MVARITPAMVARSVGVSDPRWSPSGDRLAWVVAHDGRSDLLVAPADVSSPPLVVTADTGLSGGYAWASDEELVVGAADGRLVVVGAEAGFVRALTRDGRAFGPAVSARSEVACSIEREDACDVVVVPLDGSAWPVRRSHVDYAWDCAWSPDGSLLAWHEWDLPDMPWDASRIVVSHDGDAKVIAGGGGVGVGQPRFSPAGDRLAFVSDAEGWSTIWTADIDGGNTRPVLRESREHAEPAWAPGQRSFTWSPDGQQLAWCRNEEGFGRLVIAAPGGRSARELSKGWHRGLDWSEQGIACVRSGGVTPPHVVVLAANGSGRRAIARGPVGGFEATDLVEPRPVTWKSANANVHGLLYRPTDATRPALVVHVHGGPTSQALVDWSARTQWFVQQGFGVLAVNYRGSTGYGRAYAQALAGKWGERDVADVASGIRHAIKEGWCDPDRVVLMGGSAGGMTALLVAAQHGDLVAAVVALYPVADLVDLQLTTHRFESGYNLRLVGPWPGARERYVERSPITHVSQIRTPVLLLHGSDDKVVSPAQSAAIEAALRASGVPVERHVYDGEGHGWRHAATLADEMARVEAFLTRWA